MTCFVRTFYPDNISTYDDNLMINNLTAVSIDNGSHSITVKYFCRVRSEMHDLMDVWVHIISWGRTCSSQLNNATFQMNV